MRVDVSFFIRAFIRPPTLLICPFLDPCSHGQDIERIYRHRVYILTNFFRCETDEFSFVFRVGRMLRRFP